MSIKKDGSKIFEKGRTADGPLKKGKGKISETDFELRDDGRRIKRFFCIMTEEKNIIKRQGAARAED